MAVLLLLIICLIVVLAALFYVLPAPYTYVGRFVGLIAALILFLVAVGVLHL